jgi:hypothetical protein
MCPDDLQEKIEAFFVNPEPMNTTDTDRGSIAIASSNRDQPKH